MLQIISRALIADDLLAARLPLYIDYSRRLDIASCKAMPAAAGFAGVVECIA